MKRLFSLILIVGISNSVALGQYYREGRTSSKSYLDSTGNLIQHGWAGYLAASAGYSTYNSNLSVEGVPTSLKFLGSYVSKESTGVFDIGFGLQNQIFSQKSAADHSISTAVIEVAGRYQFGNGLQFGGVFNQFFNKGTNYNANQADAQFGGLQVLREFSFAGSYLGRVGGRMMTGLNLNSESVNIITIDFQIGWGGGVNPLSPARMSSASN